MRTELLVAAAATGCELLIRAHSAGSRRCAARDCECGRGRVVSVHRAVALGVIGCCVERREMMVDHRERSLSFARQNRVRVAECARVVSKSDPDPVHVSYGDP